MFARRGAAVIGSAAVLALGSGCGMLGLGGEEPESDEARLIELFNESNRLDSELYDAEYRIVQDCLEDAGFTVHDAWSMQAYTEPERDALTSYYPHDYFLIDPAEAAEYGFGQWANSPDGWEDPASEAYYQAQEEKWAEEDDWEEPDNSEFDALDPAEQYAWYVAYWGPEYTEYSYGSESDWVEGSMGGWEEEEEFVEGEEELPEGELEFEEESWDEPKPGGCQLEMIEALYGEPRLVEETWQEDGESGAYSYWQYRPVNPAWDQEDMWEDIEYGYTDKMGDLQYEFLDCLEGKGLKGWEFDEYNGLPIWEFFGELYYQDMDESEREMYMGRSDAEVPPIPDTAGSSYEEWKAFEIQTAVDFADCGEQTDYAKVSKETYDQLHVDAYKAIEEDVYAWQQDMKDAIGRAKEILEA